MESSDIWNKSLKIIQERLNIRSFDIWFRPLKASFKSPYTLLIESPNKFFKNWLIEHYSGIIQSAVSKVSNNKTEIEYIVTSEEESKLPEKSLIKKTDKKKTPVVGVKSVTSFFNLNPRYTFENFVIGSSNRFAHAACVAAAESPAKAYNPIFIYGNVGLGKTHLLQAMGDYICKTHDKLKISYISSEEFTNQLINSIQNRTTLKFRERYRKVDILLIDDIHFIAGKESTQEEFFHTFNALYDSHKQIVISSDRSPKEIKNLEERLISRFEWGLVIDIQPPDLETRIAILRKKLENEPVEIPNDVTFFIADKINTNIRELEGALIRVVAHSTLFDKKITVDLAKQVLKDTLQEEGGKINIDIIQKHVANYFDIRLSDMKTKKRSKVVVHPRQVAMYLVRRLTDHSFPEIGEFFGGKDHTTILHAYNKIARRVQEDDKMEKLIEDLVKIIKCGK